MPLHEYVCRTGALWLTVLACQLVAPGCASRHDARVGAESAVDAGDPAWNELEEDAEVEAVEAGLAADSGSASAGPDASSAAPKANAEELNLRCAPFGATFSSTCAGCPKEDLCPCLKQPMVNLSLFLIGGRCGSNQRCLRDLDCTELCEKADAGVPQVFLNGLSDDLFQIRECISQVLSECMHDEDCTSGVCVGEELPEGGHCGPTDKCYEPSDCKVGQCLVTPEPPSSPGQLVYGFCSRGMRGEACYANAHCQAGLYCAVNTPAGACLDGRLGDACDSDANCQSHICFRARCTAGALADPCDDDSDCVGLRCTFNSSTSRKECLSGALGGVCYSDEQCESGICALRRLEGRIMPGYCQTGMPTSPCSADSECKSGHCGANVAVRSDCASDGRSTARSCGDAGICALSVGVCFMGRCEP